MKKLILHLDIDSERELRFFHKQLMALLDEFIIKIERGD